MDVCVRCGAELGVGRFCLNCGHPVGEPVDDSTPADFLPWEAEPEPDDQDGPSWLPWVLGAAGLVALALLLMPLLGGDDEPGETSAATERPASGEESRSSVPPATKETTSAPPAPRGKPRDVSRSATVSVPVTAPATTDLDGQLVAYTADQMLDGQPATAWRMPGDGTGTVVTFTFARPTSLTRLGLVNGYAKQVGGVDWYPNNRRIVSAQWAFDDGSVVTQTFAEQPQVQLMPIEPVTSRTVRLTLTGVTPPGAGDLGRDYTAISEVRFIGRPGG